jgi:hypothetical protein
MGAMTSRWGNAAVGALWGALTAFGAANCGSSAEDDTKPAGDGGSAGHAVSGAAGQAGAGAPPSITPGGLGDRCERDADCDSGLACSTAEDADFGGEGPAGGYCTLRCSATDECQSLAPGAQCVDFGGPFPAAFCMRGCDPGPAGGFDFLPSKCYARSDVACSRLGADEDAVHVCLPRCGSDADCGEGLHCLPDTGLCGKKARAGDMFFSACDPDATADTCRGGCVDLGLSQGVCLEACVFGTPGCGWDGPGSGPAAGFCDYTTSPGDRGLCTQLCDCTQDCRHPDTRCAALPLAFQRALERAGQCVIVEPGAEVPGRELAECEGSGGAGNAGAPGASGAPGHGDAGRAGKGGASG